MAGSNLDKISLSPSDMDKLETEIGNILGDRPSFVKDVAPHHISRGEVELFAAGDGTGNISVDPFKQEPLVLPATIPAAVEKMCAALIKQWTETANQCDERADALERVVSEFRRRAVSLRNACNIIPAEIRDNVLLEMESHERAAYTSAINPLPD